jgi:hypothetical protein
MPIWRTTSQDPVVSSNQRRPDQATARGSGEPLPHKRPPRSVAVAGISRLLSLSAQTGRSGAARTTYRLVRTYRQNGGYLRGHTKTQVALGERESPSARVFSWRSSRFRTDRMACLKSLSCPKSARPRPRQIRAPTKRTVCLAAYRPTVGPGASPLAGADPCHHQRLRTVAGCGSRTWTRSPDNPSATSAIRAITRAIGAASACADRDRAPRVSPIWHATGREHQIRSKIPDVQTSP